MQDIDAKYNERADEHIKLSNNQLKGVSLANVSASTMFASTRFSVWVSATEFKTSDKMKADRNEIINYYTTEYKSMFEEHLDDYIKNFDQYMNVK